MADTEDEEPTQQATQLTIDPRRYGEQHSGFDDNDLADIFCILHPITIPACIAVSNIHSRTPEHTINAGAAPVIPTTGLSNGANAAAPGSFELAARGITSCDLALRLSAKTKNPQGGFQFGRHTQRCDLLLGYDDPKRRISNVHFRIYITEHGIVMLEDTSTNGTLVDNDLLRPKQGRSSKHTLANGTIISFIPAAHGEEVIKFVVRLPQRHGLHDEMYDINLQEYHLRLAQAKNCLTQPNTTTPALDRNMAGEAPDIFAKENMPPISTIASTLPSKRRRNWQGGDKYNVHDVIGKGAFATVYMITTKYEGRQFACKELEKRRFIKNGILDQKVENEMKIMSKIRHPNIVRFIEHVDHGDHLYLVMEYVPNGDLGSLIGNGDVLNEPAARTMTAQLVSALDYIHENGITHRDVKPDNILIESLAPFHVKLTDFGLSKMVNDEETFLRTFCGTLLYCAPEVYTEYREYDAYGRRTNRRNHLLPQQYSNAVDVWSLGAVMYYALSGVPPYPAQNGTTHQELLHKIMSTRLNTSPLAMSNVSEQGIAFIASMLRIDPASRCSVKALQRDSWLLGCNEVEDIPAARQQAIDDLVVDTDEQLEQGASQLSIRDGCDEATSPWETFAATTRNAKIEIPSSIPSMEEDESSRSVSDSANRPRLFGENDPAALRSSGVLGNVNLNLALSEFGPAGHLDAEASALDATGGSYEHPPGDMNSFKARGAQADLSLLGAESMVGNLIMDSPSPATTNDDERPPSSSLLMPPPPLKDGRPSIRHISSPGAGQEHSERSIAGPNASLLGRHGRDDLENVDPRGEAKRPATDRTISQMNMSKWPIPSTEHDDSAGTNPSRRLITGTFSEKLLWDSKDPSTHLCTGDRMTIEEYSTLEKEAAALQEKPYRNSPSFPRLIENFNKRRSASSEAQHLRAQSAPLQQLQDNTNDESHATPGSEPAMILEDVDVAHEVACKSLKWGPATDTKKTLTSDGITSKGAQTVNFSPSAASADTNAMPERTTTILDAVGPPSALAFARLSSTEDSHMPPITFELRDILTVWGRGEQASVRYWNIDYSHISKYHFKLALWASDGSGSLEGARFYITSPRPEGLCINGHCLPPLTSKEADGRIWAELCHNDLITISMKPANKFRFECFTGQSCQERVGTPSYVADGSQQEQLNEWVDNEQAKMTQRRADILQTNASILKQDRDGFLRAESLLREKLGRPRGSSGRSNAGRREDQT